MNQENPIKINLMINPSIKRQRGFITKLRELGFQVWTTPICGPMETVAILYKEYSDGKVVTLNSLRGTYEIENLIQTERGRQENDKIT